MRHKTILKMSTHIKSGKADLASKLCIYLAQVFILKSIKNPVNKKLANCWE